MVHIVRDPRDILRSLEVWERGEWPRSDTEIAVRDWTRVAASFWSAATELPPWVLRVRYEDLIADPAHWCARLAEHCGLEEDLLDRRVFDRRIHAVGLGGRVRRTILDWPDLPASLRALLDDDEVRRVGQACGYALNDAADDDDAELGTEAVEPLMAPACSVIIPTYDRAELLRRTLDCLVRQDLPAAEFEVLVVDDGSSDHTAEVAAAMPAGWT